MAFVVEMVAFKPGKLPEPYKRLPGAESTLAAAEKKGRREISVSNLHHDPIGFRILDDSGRELLVWQVGNKDDG